MTIGRGEATLAVAFSTVKVLDISMNNDELISFNAILAKALAQAEKEHSQKGSVGIAVIEFLREFVALAVKTGVEPAKIYATIKTGRILTTKNMKLLTKADIREWQDAVQEYDELANTKTPATEERRAMAKKFTLQLRSRSKMSDTQSKWLAKCTQMAPAQAQKRRGSSRPKSSLRI